MEKPKRITLILGIITIALLALCMVLWMRGDFAGPPGDLHIQVHIDGSQTIKVKGKRLWYEHHSWKRPGELGMQDIDEPGKLEDDLATYINGTPWIPQWKDDICTPHLSHWNLIPRDGQELRLTRRSGAGIVNITAVPGRANGFTLSILIDDSDHGGTSFYDLLVEW